MSLSNTARLSVQSRIWGSYSYMLLNSDLDRDQMIEKTIAMFPQFPAEQVVEMIEEYEKYVPELN